MPNTYQGNPTAAAEGRFAIVVARFNESITSRLLEGAVQTLVAHGVADERIDVAWTPGAFEIPTVANRLAASGRYAAVICLGAVIRGETTPRPAHQPRGERGVVRNRRPLRIAGAVRHSHLQHARSGHRPLGRTSGHDRQGRSPASLGNKGVDCALAALEMVDLLAKLPEK